MPFGLEKEICDTQTLKRAIEHFSQAGICLPRLSTLANPNGQNVKVPANLTKVNPDAADWENLFRVHWYNGEDRSNLVKIPDHLVLPQALTGVEAKIIVAIGNRFPMVRAHKVLAAYGCLVPRVITGRFDPTRHRAVWPSTGNYCRGGIAISRILGCRGLAVLPEGMSRERFQWLENWVTVSSDILRTPGTESNVKEIYDVCHELKNDPDNIILNQFSDFGNYIVHRAVTGPALKRVFEAVAGDTRLQAKAFVAATGSAGTLAAGDYLKKIWGTDICAVEAIECPTLLMNGYGAHNIQGIGDKHVPLIHNALNTDYVIAVSGNASDALNLLFNTNVGQEYLEVRTGLGQAFIQLLADLGLSSIANLLAAIKYAKYHNLGPDDAVLTIATDGSELYGTELDRARQNMFGGNFDLLSAAEIYGRYLLGIGTDSMKELTHPDRQSIFNLGYYTWVEQQNISIQDFDVRRDQFFWDNLMDFVPIWDDLIDDFNRATGQNI